MTESSDEKERTSCPKSEDGEHVPVNGTTSDPAYTYAYVYCWACGKRLGKKQVIRSWRLD